LEGRRACYKDGVRALVFASVMMTAIPLARAADMSPPLPPTVDVAPVVVAPRPRFDVAVGAGVSFDASGFSPARTEWVPAMFATGGVGADWPVGAELALFASTAVGRFRAPDAPI